jgi:hypothetical protein
MTNDGRDYDCSHSAGVPKAFSWSYTLMASIRTSDCYSHGAALALLLALLGRQGTKRSATRNSRASLFRAIWKTAREEKTEQNHYRKSQTLPHSISQSLLRPSINAKGLLNGNVTSKIGTIYDFVGPNPLRIPLTKA